MPSCLGIYIENNIIKYAKVSKEKENIKVGSIGTKFYENLNEVIKQIIEETNSYKTLISVNLNNEKYTYFNMFSLLNKKDLQKAIDIEFDTYCTENKLNSKAVETRYAAVNSKEDKEKLRILHINTNKTEIDQIKHQFEGNRLAAIVPISTSIANLLKINAKENILIVNIEENTIVTTIYNQEIYNIVKIEEGSKAILDRINEKENSYSKSYEILKNTTIFTSDAQDILEDDNGYLEDIMPPLYEIVGKVQKVLNESVEKIDKIYITGTGANINNIDLYFQEYLGDVKCEILKPYFVQSISKEYNIKDYIEVNSALSLALQGLGEGLASMNFKEASLKDKIPEINVKTSNSYSQKNDLNESLTKGEQALVRCIIAVLVFFVAYSVFSNLIVDQIDTKTIEANERTMQIKTEIAKVQEDILILDKRTNEYSNLLNELKEASEKNNTVNTNKNDIPNLLNKIMFIIPEQVQITSIQNAIDKQVAIEAQSENYEELGYFIAKLKTDQILINVKSDSGIKQEGIVKVTIEGELP